MAHEALKFKVEVNDTHNWQPIVGNQHHGTFYMIYIKFKSVERKNDLYIYTVDFKLQNFNGNITMGLFGIPTIERRDYAKDKTDLQNEIKRINLQRQNRNEKPMTKQEIETFFEEHKIDFDIMIPVQPFNNKFEHKDQKDPDTDKFINQSIILEAIEIPLKGTVLNTICKLSSPSNYLYDRANLENSLYVNPYHYERAGDEFLEVGSRNKGETGKFDSITQAGTKPLTKCNPSRSFLI